MTMLGSSPGQMRFALDHLGIGFETLNCAYGSVRDVPAPAILFVDHPAVGVEGHAVVYVGRVATVDTFEILDPIDGRHFAPLADVERIWHGNGIACHRRDQQ